jgi:hypothetical protein
LQTGHEQRSSILKAGRVQIDDGGFGHVRSSYFNGLDSKWAGWVAARVIKSKLVANQVCRIAAGTIAPTSILACSRPV